MARPAEVAKGSRFVVLAAVCVVVAALYFAQDVLIPLALAVLLTFLLTPVVRLFERWRLGRVGSVMMVLLMTLALIGSSLAIAACNTVRGAAADVNSAANTVDNAT